MLDKQFLRMLVEQPQKKFKNIFVNCLETMTLNLQFNTRKVINLVDVTLNLENLTYHPYLKDNNKIIHVNTESSHPCP